MLLYWKYTIYENCLPGPDFAQLLFLSSISAFIVAKSSLGLEKDFVAKDRNSIGEASSFYSQD